jgi:hypothetical protein
MSFRELSCTWKYTAIKPATELQSSHRQNELPAAFYATRSLPGHKFVGKCKQLVASASHLCKEGNSRGFALPKAGTTS